MAAEEKTLFLRMIDPRRVFKNGNNVSLPFLFSMVEDKFGSKYIYQSEPITLLVMDRSRKPLFNITVDEGGIAVSIANPMLMDAEEGSAFYDFIQRSVD